MKIIMNNIKTPSQADEAFRLVEYAINDGIKEGRNNFKSYGFFHSGNDYTICKNKSSFTVYRQNKGRTI